MWGEQGTGNREQILVFLFFYKTNNYCVFLSLFLSQAQIKIANFLVLELLDGGREIPHNLLKSCLSV